MAGKTIPEKFARNLSVISTSLLDFIALLRHNQSMNNCSYKRQKAVIQYGFSSTVS